MAQAGHAAQIAWWDLTDTQRKQWSDNDFHLAVRTASRTEWPALAASGLPVVRDAGFTEIAPGSCTVVADLPALRGQAPLAGPDLSTLQARLIAFAAARNWQPFHTPKNLAMALTVEAGELMEIFQWLTPEEAATAASDPELGPRIKDEVADVLAYLLQFSDACGVDPLVALAEKIERNELRFPARPPTD
jgi:NTP pyrophosphatase (non-canonical NTP hydrolase)